MSIIVCSFAQLSGADRRIVQLWTHGWDVGDRLRMMGDNTYNKPINCIADVILSANEGSDEEYFYLYK